MISHFHDGRDWFFEKRYGLFVHFGIYAITKWHEQIMLRKNIPRSDYAKLALQFNPVNFDPHAWLDVMEEAGMEYICITTKHHDGFCLWDTALTKYNVMNTPYGKDFIGMLAAACHERHVPLCLYYSVADWHHPNYPNQGRSHELAAPVPGDQPDLQEYLEFLRGQIKELLTQYGEIHGLWWDMNVTEHIDPTINDFARSLQPKLVINDRGFDPGDFTTHERLIPPGARHERPTENCQSVGKYSWGYKADEAYYSIDIWKKPSIKHWRWEATFS